MLGKAVAPALLALTGALMLAGCSPDGSSETTSTPTATPQGNPSATGPDSPTVEKLLVFVVENHSLDQMRSEMPYTWGLATRYGYADDYSAIRHPSLPNYLAMVGGDTFGVADDGPPSTHELSGASVFGEAATSGSTARLYADGMTTPCQLDSSGTYVVKHNPWAYFVDERSQCRRGDVPIEQLGRDVTGGILPAVGMVVPDLCHDAHDCSLAQADTWMRQYVGQVLAGPDWASGHLAVVITADEDDDRHGNRILTVVMSPALRHLVVHSTLDHYALSRSYAAVAGVPPLRNAAGAPSLLARFGLRVE